MTEQIEPPTRFAAVVEYDGSAYQGFQRQLPEKPTIQGALEVVLGRMAGRHIPVVGAGRTDSGVHAIGQVVSFMLSWRHDPTALQRAMNAWLPADIAVRRLAEVDVSFHPRFDARRRTYEYLVYNEPIRSPLRIGRCWHVRQPLVVETMNQAAQYLLGRHDFATFGRAPVGENTVREVFEAEWQQRHEFLVFRVTANAFLYRMVRSIVGTLRRVGDGSWQGADFEAALAARSRGRSGGLAPPNGLFLLSVEYDESRLPPG